MAWLWNMNAKDGFPSHVTVLSLQRELPLHNKRTRNSKDLWTQRGKRCRMCTFSRPPEAQDDPRKEALLLMVAKSVSHHFETTVETIVGWYLQGNHHSRRS